MRGFLLVFVVALISQTDPLKAQETECPDPFVLADAFSKVFPGVKQLVLRDTEAHNYIQHYNRIGARTNHQTRLILFNIMANGLVLFIAYNRDDPGCKRLRISVEYHIYIMALLGRKA